MRPEAARHPKPRSVDGGRAADDRTLRIRPPVCACVCGGRACIGSHGRAERRQGVSVQDSGGGRHWLRQDQLDQALCAQRLLHALQGHGTSLLQRAVPRSATVTREPSRTRATRCRGAHFAVRGACVSLRRSAWTLRSRCFSGTATSLCACSSGISPVRAPRGTRVVELHPSLGMGWLRWRVAHASAMDGCWTHTGQERFGNMTRVRAPESHTVYLVIGH